MNAFWQRRPWREPDAGNLHVRFDEGEGSGGLWPLCLSFRAFLSTLLVKKNPACRFADLVALVRFALEHQPVLAPFADSVSERFREWLRTKDAAVSQPSTLNPQPTEPGTIAFSPNQLSWLRLIRDHIATAISIEPEDLDLTPFNQRGGLGKAHQLFGEGLPALLDELNTVLAA